MAAIIKNDLRVYNSDTFRYSILNNPCYVFISGTTPWDSESEPPMPEDTTSGEYKALEDLVAVKRILQSDVISVVPRTNWISGTIYDQYDHEIDLINTRNPNTGDFWRFYVLTEDFNVYKCLSNNYNTPSLDRPTGTAPEPFQTPDGYIWKYMYTIQASDAFRFMTVNWMPCYTLDFNDGSALWNSQQSAIPGTIDNIDVLIKGTGYNSNNPPTIIINGDGTGATASAIVNPVTGELDNIVVNDNGTNYTYADIVIDDGGGSGVGATARAIIGPRKGHGFDPRIELGATYLMIKVTIDGDEGGVIPVDIEYRTSGIISMPGDITANGYTIKVATGASRLFSAGETITGQTSSATATILQIDYLKDIIHVNNVVGTFSQSELISSQSYNETPIETIHNGFLPLTSLVYSSSSINKEEGKLLFIANREKITRVAQQKEDIVAIISF